MKLIDFLSANKATIAATLATAHGVAVHAFMTVRNYGGLRKMWADFLGPKPTPGGESKSTEQ